MQEEEGRMKEKMMIYFPVSASASPCLGGFKGFRNQSPPLLVCIRANQCPSFSNPGGWSRISRCCEVAVGFAADNFS